MVYDKMAQGDSNMSDFWVNFGSGLAAGIVLIILGVLIRRVFRRRAKDEPLVFNAKELRPLIAVVTGFALIFIDIFLVPDSGLLMGLGGMVALFGALEFLS